MFCGKVGRTPREKQKKLVPDVVGVGGVLSQVLEEKWGEIGGNGGEWGGGRGDSLGWGFFLDIMFKL